MSALIQQLRESPHVVVPWLVLLLPLAGFIVLALFGDWIKRDKEDDGAALLACGTSLGSFGLCLWSVSSMLHLAGGLGLPSRTWVRGLLRGMWIGRRPVASPL
jgi:hypothetical protein